MNLVTVEIMGATTKEIMAATTKEIMGSGHDIRRRIARANFESEAAEAQ